MTTIDTQVNEIVDAHLSVYSNPDSTGRRQRVERVYAPDAHIFEPPLDANGHAAIVDLITGLQAQFPEHTFRRTTGVDSHHGLARYGWALDSPSGKTVLTGLDVVVLGEDDRIVRVAGFFGDPPALD